MEFVVNWGDGSGDKITVSYSEEYGNQEITVVTDANNTKDARSKTLTFSTYNYPYKQVTLTITQNPNPLNNNQTT